jgi:hypothetical protein
VHGKVPMRNLGEPGRVSQNFGMGSGMGAMVCLYPVACSVT